MVAHRSSATTLALLYAALIVYASWHPFTGWRVPSFAPWAFFTLPWPAYWTWFDIIANVVGYLPLGVLVTGALLRSAVRPAAAFTLACMVGAAMTTLMEAGQTFLPMRVPSNVDWVLNVTGTVLGATVAVVAHALGLVDRWQRVRERWFIPRSAGGLVLLALWPLALLFPSPTPLGLGHIADRALRAISDWLDGTPFSHWITPRDPALMAPLSPGLEFIAIVLGLLMPCLVAFSVSPPNWRRLVLVLGAGTLGWAATTLSTALSFSPQHALTWATAPSSPGWVAGMGLGFVCSALSPRAAAAVGLVVITAAMALVNNAPADPYFAANLSAWEQGRFIRFHGVAHWLSWLWPYAALWYLLWRTLQRDARG